MCRKGKVELDRLGYAKESYVKTKMPGPNRTKRWRCDRCEICVDCEGPCRVFDGTSAEARELYFNVAKCTQCVNCNKKQRLQ